MYFDGPAIEEVGIVFIIILFMCLSLLSFDKIPTKVFNCQLVILESKEERSLA